MASSFKEQESVFILDSLLHIMKSNDVPTPQETLLARHQVDVINRELEKVQHEIEALKSQLTRLQARAESLHGVEEEYLPIFSPWRGLPVDILAEILQIAVNPGSTSFLSPNNQSTNRMHFKNLRAVCRTWREVAFSTQSLWTSVWVDFDHYPGEEVPAVIRSVSKYFKRSGTALPLELGFRWKRHPAHPTGSEDDGQGSSCLFSDVWLAYLFSQRSRLREITLYTSTLLLKLFDTKLKGWIVDGETWKVNFLLVYLERARPNVAIAPSDPGGIVPASFPELKSLSFTGTASVLSWDVLQGYSRLSTLHLTIDGIDTFFPTLVGFPCLEELSLTFFRATTNNLPNNATTLNLPHLRHLSLSCLTSFSLLSKLQAPALISLYISCAPAHAQLRWATATVKQEWWETFPKVIKFIQEIGQQFEAFHLDSWFIQNDEVLDQLFGVLSSVKLLCTDTWYDDSEEFRSRDTSTHLPHLTSLCIHLPHENPFSPLSSEANRAPLGWQPSRWKSLGTFLRSRSLKLTANTVTVQGPERDDGDRNELVVYLPEQASTNDALEWGELEQLPGLNLRTAPSCEVLRPPPYVPQNRSSAQRLERKFPEVSWMSHSTACQRKAGM